MDTRLIGTLVAACALALPATAGAANGAQDSVVGSGSALIEALSGGNAYTHVRFSARSGPNGEDPQGFITGTYSATSLSGGVVFPTGTFTGHVVCMSVNGTLADVMGKLDEPIMTPTGPADMIALHVQDNGAPVGGEAVDSIASGFYQSGTHVLGECDQSSTNEYRPGRGNAVVNDAS